MRAHSRPLLAAVVVLLAAATAHAAITQFVGRVTARVIERLTATNEAIGFDDQSDEYVSPSSDTLPIQAVARVSDEDGQAAGVAAAQFADPRTASGSDPDEFSVNLVLAVDRSDASFEGAASSSEERTILISSAEAGGRPAGATFNATGRFFVDGALTVFATKEAAALNDAFVALRVRVERQGLTGTPTTVFEGEIRLVGGAGRAVVLSKSGNFPETGVFTIDLPGVDPTLSVFRIVVFPSLQFDYTYQAVVGQPFILRASVLVDAKAASEGVGVAALIGTPASSLVEVVTQTIGASTADHMSKAIARERENPSGEPAFVSSTPDLSPLNWFGLCGLFGLESVVGALAVVGLAVGRRTR